MNSHQITSFSLDFVNAFNKANKANNPYIITQPTCISFSGGRTSAYMLYKVLEANDGLPEMAKVCFANTGKEMIETFDEDLFYEVTKIVNNPYYMHENDKIRIEEFEEKHESKFNEIQEIIKINNL